MPMDGSETSNIERQSIGTLLPDRQAPLKRHGANVVDRSFRQTAIPLGSTGTPENILGTLLEAAGHVGTAAGTYMQQKVDEDKTVQAMRFYEGMAPSDEATTAGYRTHAVLGMSNKILESTARLKDEASTFTGTDEEWEQKVRDTQTADHNDILSKYPHLSNDPLANKAVVTMYGEQVPAIAAARISAKLNQEHQQRLTTFRDHIRVRVDGLSTDEAHAVLAGVMDDTDTLQLTKTEREKELVALAVEKAEAGELGIINFSKKYTGGAKTSLFDRSHALQKSEVSGKKVYWLQNQDKIAADKNWLQGKMDNGELTKDQFFEAAAEMNRQYSNLAYTDDSMLAAVNKGQKETPWLKQAAYADSASATLDELNSGKFKGNRAGFFARAGQDNVKHNAMVWTDDAMRAAWEKHEKDTAVNVDARIFAEAMSRQTELGVVPLGQTGMKDADVQAGLKQYKADLDKAALAVIAKLPAGSTPQQVQEVKDHYRTIYLNNLGKSGVVDKEIADQLKSLETVDMSHAADMKHLNPHTAKLIELANSLPEPALYAHLPDPKHRAILTNYNSQIEQGQTPVAAMEKAMFAFRHPRVVTDKERDAAVKEAAALTKKLDSRYRSPAGYMPGAVWFGWSDKPAPAWYTELRGREILQGIFDNVQSGVINTKDAGAMYLKGYEASHTKLPNGTFVRGTSPVLAHKMAVQPNDVPKIFQAYLEMNKEYLEDSSHLPISEMYFVTNPERGTFMVKDRLGNPLTQQLPLSTMKRGAGAFLENKEKLFKQQYMPKFNGGPQSGALGMFQLSQPETHPEDTARLAAAVQEVEGKGGYDERIGVFKPYRDGNGKQWNIGYGLKISDKEYNQDYIERNGTRYNLGRVKPSQITDTVAKSLMEQELSRADSEVRKYWAGYDKLPVQYKHVLQALHYNTGSVKPSNWPKLMQAMNNRDNNGVKAEMLTHYINKDGDKVYLKSRADALYKRLIGK